MPTIDPPTIVCNAIIFSVFYKQGFYSIKKPPTQRVRGSFIVEKVLFYQVILAARLKK